MRPYLLLLLLLLASAPLWSEVKFTQIGAPLASTSGVLSCWLVEGGNPSRAVVIKVTGLTAKGESNVALGPNELVRLREACDRAKANKTRLKKGQIVLLESIPSGENKLDVALVRPDASVLAVLVAHEGQKEHTFMLEAGNRQALGKLLDKALKTLQ